MADRPDQIKLLIRLDADHRTGLGHAVRVAALLKHITVPLDLHVYGTGEQVRQYFGDNATLHMLTDSGAENPARLLALAREIKADILLIDHPAQTRQCWQRYDDSPFPVIAIDDCGGDVQADLILNGTILDAYHRYPLISDRARIFCGGSYALLNPCFAGTPWSDPSGESLVTVIGGGGRACDWVFRLVGADGPLSTLDIARKTLIVGAAFPQFEQLGKECKKHNIGLYQGLDQTEVARMLSTHSAGLITGGMIVYEALATGLPVMIFPQEKNLPPEARYFAERGSLVDLGYNGGMNMGHVEREIKKMMNSPEKRLTLSRNGKQLIDGQGMRRTIKILKNFFENADEGHR